MLAGYPCLREVIVNCKTASVFRGVLWKRRRGYLILRQATLLRPGGERVAVDGEVMVERANVDFLQVLG